MSATTVPPLFQGLPALAQGSFERLEVLPGNVQLVPTQYPATNVWTYGGSVPGSEIRLRQGERVQRRVVNNLDQPTTVHWHGIRIDNAMDGVSGMTQPAIAPGGHFDYDFVVPDAGTYWYHPHANTLEQLSRGLAGALIVEEAAAPDIDRELVLMINDWRLDREAQITSDFDNMHDASHGGRIGNHLTVNGRDVFSEPVKRHERLRLRIINAATGRILRLAGSKMTAYIMAVDGMPLDAPEPMDTVILAPAQRVDLFVDITAEAGETADLVSVERDGNYSLAAFKVSGSAATSLRDTPATLPPNAWRVPDVENAKRYELVMQGGAMGRMMGARMPDGRRMGMRQLVGEGRVWAFNGVAGMATDPLADLSRGETAIITIKNETAWPHAMHLHGHHFQTVMDGEASGPKRDTVLIERNSEIEIAFVADNPGDWMFHCHMIAHQQAGMMTWVRVAA